MTFLAPLALALLALIPPIIALYLLKLRRQDHPVSSIYLWQRFVRDVEANAPWQRLRRNLLLLLQILFMLALILALARPAGQAEGSAAQATVLVLDTSASMAAADGEAGPGFGRATTRLETATAAARELVVNLPDKARITVITAAGGGVETLVSASQNRRQVLEALAGIRPTALNSDLTQALTLAEAIVAREPEAEIVLFSDGAVQVPAISAPVRLVAVGRAVTNQAISALSIDHRSDRPALFVQVSNYGRQPAQRRLVLEADGVTFTAFDLALSPGEHVSRLVETLPQEAQVVTARLEPAPDDPLAVDDQAWTVNRQAGPVRATLVTAGNTFLQTALSLLRPSGAGANVELTTMSPEDWQAGSLENRELDKNRLQSADLTIFDATIPETLPPGNMFFIAPPASIPGMFEVLGRVDQPIARSGDANHPLLQNLNLAEIQILNAVALAPGEWSRTVVTGSGEAAGAGATSVPLLLAGEIDGRRVAILAFDVHQSDLPLQPAFPILVANLIEYLGPGIEGRTPVQLAPGEALSLSLPPEVERVRLARPAGQEVVIPAQDGQANLLPLAEPGLYRLTVEPTEERADLAVNFFDPLESSIAPRSDLVLAGDRNPSSPGAVQPPAYREWWRPLALVALVVLMLEWLVYQRSALLEYLSILRRRLRPSRF